jgi:hypothetical protein
MSQHSPTMKRHPMHRSTAGARPPVRP